MKYYIALLLLVIGIVISVPSKVKVLANRTSGSSELRAGLIRHLDASTVMILEGTEEGYKVSCAGVWISDNKFITAAHCLTDKSSIMYQVYSERDSDTDGNYDKFYSGIVVKYSIDDDLALIYGYGGNHDKVDLSGARIGQRIWSIGHPSRYIYSIVDGMISGLKEVDTQETIHTLWQINSNIGPGDSGGIFNNNGDLVGVCSFISLNFISAKFGFFTTSENVVEFINR